ncbi:metallo-hydrolase/oxidoreductase superfamily protein [Tanacetum coccineum]
MRNQSLRSLQEISSAVLLKVDVDELQSVAGEFSVDAMPTFLSLKNGEEVDKIVGADKGLARIIMKHAADAADYPCSVAIFWHKYRFLFLNCLQQCYVKRNRRNREDTILKAIEAGLNTLFNIVAYTYADIDCAYWIPAASNVRLHVDHLAHQYKLLHLKAPF